MKDQVEAFELWQEVEEGGEAYSFDKQKNLKLVAHIINGVVLRLDKGFMLEKKTLTKAEADNTIKIYGK